MTIINITKAPMVMAFALLSPVTLLAQNSAADETHPVTVKSFARAESDLYAGNVAKLGGFGKFFHYRSATPIEDQTIVRMNRDTLYSGAVFDLDAGPVTITLPDPGERFMSLQIINQDHYSPATVYGPSSVTLTREVVGTRYAVVAIRTFADADSEDDIRAANQLQDQINVEQAGRPGVFEVPNWDRVAQGKIRKNLADLQSMGGCVGIVRMGTADEVDAVCHLLATATGWGLNPQKDAVYDTRYPSPNTGSEVVQLTVKDVPVDGFWSISMYNKEGYFELNALNSYSINNVTAVPGADGSYTIQFGECTPQSVNCLVTPPGWNYSVRMYRPRQEILDGSWAFPQPLPVR